MGKKTKSKNRLDTYYHFAKQQGYRSRAAYKLIQLNRKYNFLTHAKTVIDLCAAPGGWMQVAAETMPLNSTIVGVDLDPIKRVPGCKSFQGDITTPSCYQQLRREINDQPCDAVLNDGAPNVGANWSKDAYSQSQLVLAALKLACSFLREGGYFVTKVFRSTDFQSLMWVFKKFFERVEATKPKASRFASAQIFVVCAGYLAPAYIDDKLFDAKYVFQDTQADHFRDQLAGDITSIDKLLQERRNRGGYADDAPMHMYKQAPLKQLMETDQPLLMFAQFNKITVSKEEKEQYLSIGKPPTDLMELFEDLKVLGKREIGGILKWRGKVRHHFNLKKSKENRQKQKTQAEQEQQEQPQDSDDQLQKQVLQQQRKEIKQLRQKRQKKEQMMIKAKLAQKQVVDDEAQFGQEVDQVFGSDMEDLSYSEVEQPKQQVKQKRTKMISQQEMERNLQELYQARKQIRQQKQQQIRDAKQERKDLKEQRIINKTQKLKSRKLGADPALVPQSIQQETAKQDLGEIQFNNPLANIDDDDLYLSDNEQQRQQGPVDPDEQVQGEVSDDEAYVIPKAKTDMERRRQQMKKTREKKEKKFKKDVEEGEEVGGQIEIVPQKRMEDYNIDELAQTLTIAKKMLRNRSREQIIDGSYQRFNFEDHDSLPKWFTDDEKQHNFKQVPITKEEFRQEKERIMAINARQPKKILQAKVRKKMRVQKKLKKTQKQAEAVMSQEGLTQYNKLKQVSRLYDKSKQDLKDKKKYIVSKKGRTGAGKDSRDVRHVDSRMKKDKRSLKISKKRQIKRTHKRRGKF